MTYYVKFQNWKIDAQGVKTQWAGRKETKKFTSRKDIFLFIDKINERQTQRWLCYLKPGEKIECTDIEILEDKIVEITLSNGKVVKRKQGCESYTPGKYASNFCRICGRGLTDPLSVSRGIGPECYGKMIE